MTPPKIAILLQNQVVRFGVVGGMNTAFSYAVYALGIYVGLAYYIASFAALVFGIIVSFFTQGKIVFGAQLKGRFPAFVVMWGLLYLMNIGAIRLMVEFGMNYYTAGLIAAFPVVAASFILQKFIIFKG